MLPHRRCVINHPKPDTILESLHHSGHHKLRLPLNWPWQNTFTRALQQIRNPPLLI